MTTERMPAAEYSSSPDYELAGSLQATLNNIKTRDFVLDIQQEEALQAIGEALMSGVQSGYIEMATSTGKTTVESLLAEAAVRAGRRVLLLGPTLPILNQIIGSRSEKPTGLTRYADLPEGTVVRRSFGTAKANSTANIVAATYAGLVSDAKRDHRNMGEFDVIIADECHHSLGAQTSQVISEAFPGAFKLGLSATPDYAIDRTSDGVFNCSLYEFSLLKAIEAGKTAPVRSIIYETDEQLNLTDPRREFTDRELAPLIHNMQRNNTALELSRAYVDQGRQGIVPCVPGQANLHARLLADWFRSNGVRAVAVGNHLSAAEQAIKLKAYEAGAIDVLTFTHAIEEGWDSAVASFAINLAPTSSPVRTKQLLGRILRKKESGIESIYVDFIDQRHGITKSQYTAMHALEQEYVDFDRVLGQTRPSTIRNGMNPRLLHALSPQLLEKLRQSQGKQIQDIAVGKQVDPLIKQWEEALAKEKLPAELGDNPVLPAALDKKVRRAYARFYRDNQGEPTLQELVEELGTLSKSDQRALGSYALRVDLSDLEYSEFEDIPANDELSDPVELAEEKHRDVLIKEVLDTLSEREAKVISMRMGMTTGEPMTLDEIGKVVGLQRERVRQIESKALSKLRHPSRSKVIQDFWDDSPRRHNYTAPTVASRPEVTLEVPQAQLLDFIRIQLEKNPDVQAKQIYNSLVEKGLVEFAHIIGSSSDGLAYRLDQVKAERIQVIDSFLRAAKAQLRTQRSRVTPDEASIANIEQRQRTLELAREIIARIRFAE